MKITLPNVIVHALRENSGLPGVSPERFQEYRAWWIQVEINNAPRGPVGRDAVWFEPHREFWEEITPVVGAEIVELAGNVERCPWFLEVKWDDTIPELFGDFPFQVFSGDDPPELVETRQATWSEFEATNPLNFGNDTEFAYVSMNLALLPLTMRHAVNAAQTVVQHRPEADDPS